MNENEIYDQIDRELNGGGLIRSLWTRVYAEADGDEGKAKARYIKARAAQLAATDSSSVQGKVIPKTEGGKRIRETWNFAVVPNSLTKAQLEELEAIKENAFEDVARKNEKLKYMLAGLSLSEGGRDKVLVLLKDSFGSFLQALQKFPKDPQPYDDEDMQTVSDVDVQATYYLFCDTARHRTPKGWFASGKERAAGLAHDDEMDRIAFTVAQFLKMARVFKKS